PRSPLRGAAGPAFVVPVVPHVTREPKMFEAVEELIGEHADLEKRLADPAVHADQAEARKLNKRYAELTPIVGTYRDWKQTGDDIETARELGQDDPDFAAEVKLLERQREELTDKLRLP